MRIIKELAIIIASLFIGLVIKEIFNIPIPETVIGMIVLFVFLLLKLVKLDQVDDSASMLSNNIAFWVAPSTIGIIEVFYDIVPYIGKIVIIVVISTIVTLLATAFTIQFVQRRMANDSK